MNQDQLWGKMAKRDRFLDIKERIATPAPTIIDGGAYNGNSIELFLTYFPSAFIFAFEPTPQSVQTLRKKYGDKKNIKIFPQALGSETKKENFHILNNLVSSSFLAPSPTMKRYHGDKVELKQTVEVSLVRLDEALPGIETLDIIKLDLQGYELAALQGCGALLARTKIITSEVEFVPLYEGQPLFSEIDFFLRQKGFALLNLYDLWTHPDGQLTAGDAVYVNNAYF